MNEELKKAIEKAVKDQQKGCGCSFDIPEVELENPSNNKFGDLSTNIAMKIGKQQGENPLKIAENLVKQIQAQKLKEIEKVEAVKPGFINFYLSNEYWIAGVSEILSRGKKYADLDAGKGQKVQVEFLSANPTGPLTLANGRGGFSGDVVANVFKKAGYRVEKEYYVNDARAGQIVKLGKRIAIEYAKLYEKKFKKTIMNESALEIFERESAYKGDYYKNIASRMLGIKEGILLGQKISNASSRQEEEKALNDLWMESVQMGTTVILEDIKDTTKKMGIEFDNFFSEYEMVKREKEVNESIDFIKSKSLTKDEDGALWMKTTEFGDDKDRVLVKKDHELTYFANDIAYHFDKFSKRKFDKVVDLWGADHHGYVGRMQAATEAMGFGGKLDIIIFQMVRLIKDGKEYRMSKRKGNYVTMDDLLTEIGAKDAADVARFFFVSKSFDTHMDFDLDLAKDTSEKNPVYYVKYAYARINGILRNTKEDYSKPDLSLITEPAEIDLIKKLAELPEVVEKVIGDKKYPVHKFTYYISEIAEKFHKFYHDCKVISDDKELTKARLALVSATKTVLEITGEDILGIDLPERM